MPAARNFLMLDLAVRQGGAEADRAVVPRAGGQHSVGSGRTKVPFHSAFNGLCCGGLSIPRQRSGVHDHRVR